MIRKFISCFLLCLPLLAAAQKKDKKAVTSAATITAEDMKKHLYIIASKEMEGRDTPSPGLEKAANYIEDYFKQVGLAPGNKDSYRQYYPLYRDSMVGASMKVNGTTLELNKDFQPQTNNYAAAMRFSEVVFAGYGISDGDKRDDYKDLKVAGKLVLILDGAPADYKPAQQGFASPTGVFGKLNTAGSKGAVAVIIVYSNYPRKSMNTNSNWSTNGYRASQLPFTFTVAPDVAEKIMGEDGKSIMDKMKTGVLASKTYRAEIDMDYSKTSKTTNVSNVLGFLEGTDKKDEFVVITAHYDHIGKRNDTTINYGADDDGSGTTGVLELAQAFVEAKKAGNGPRRSILFMTVSGEEKGLWGSAYYSNHPVYPLEKTTVDLNIDMIGRTATEYLKDKDSTNYIFIIGDDKLSTDLAPITDQVNKTYSGLKLDRKYNDPADPNRFYFRSDHYNFAEKGIPIIFYFNGTHADYHRPTDTPDKINYPMMAKRTQLVFYTAWEMANRNDMLKRDIKLDKPRGF
ncbi:MAG: M28 family peptidase [Ferruginibacter sp.]|nr:M28 family peptidase [Chitinophagaceae bacterium]